MMDQGLRNALMSDRNENPTVFDRLTGNTGTLFLTPGKPHPGYLSRATDPIWPHEIAAAKKKKAKRKTEKKMRKQSRAKKK
jgi:hypothetical protein